MKGSAIIGFVLGATVGGVSAWLYTKSKYEALLEEEAVSFRNKVKELKENYKKEESVLEKESPSEIKKRNDEMVESVIEGVKKIQKEHQYVNYSDSEKNEDSAKKIGGSEDFVRKEDIKVVTSKEWFDESEGYKKCGIALYSDAVFCDDADEEMSDGYLSETIGLDIRDDLVDSEDLDTVYVRNFKTKTDYEIVCFAETWEEVHDSK